MEVRDLRKHFPIRKGVFSRVSGWVRAVDGVNLDIREGETYESDQTDTSPATYPILALPTGLTPTVIANDDLVRIAVGCESYEDLEADMARVLDMI